MTLYEHMQEEYHRNFNRSPYDLTMPMAREFLFQHCASNTCVGCRQREWIKKLTDYECRIDDRKSFEDILNMDVKK